jgi:hypothetical protein
MQYMRCFYCSKPILYFPCTASHVHYLSRIYPEVTPEKFQKSAGSILELLPQADLFLKKVKKSQDFAKKIRSLAQEGNTNEVKKHINASGITSEINVDYNPDQITILLYNQSGSLTFILPW